MKTRLIFTLLLGFSTLAFIFFQPEVNITSFSTQPAADNDRFVYGSFQNIWGYPNNDTLGFNTVHSYISTRYNENLNRHVPYGWAGDNDSLTADITANISDLREIKSSVYNHNRSRMLYQRPKIEWLAYGQSSIYEAEFVSSLDEMWFYGFNINNGRSIIDSGKSVLHCSEPRDNAGIVLSRLRANTEQCRSGNPSGINQWHGDDECIWYIKPRIRIDSAFANNPANFNLPVCRIIVINQRLDTIKNVILKVKNFFNENEKYDGRYLETFRQYLGDDTLTIRGAWGDWWGLSARGTSPSDSGRNQADIQVWWYGNCDIWLDYIKVENDVAHNLLSDTINNPQHEEYIRWLKTEAEAVAEHPSVYKFYVEIVEFNNLPCINYVNRKLREYSKNSVSFQFSLH
jgi:hypothetical protein